MSRPPEYSSRLGREHSHGVPFMEQVNKIAGIVTIRGPPGGWGPIQPLKQSPVGVRTPGIAAAIPVWQQRPDLVFRRVATVLPSVSTPRHVHQAGQKT